LASGGRAAILSVIFSMIASSDLERIT
jgi:hypothetical protein